MKLNIKERLVLFSILPRESNFKTFQTLKAMRNVLSISDEERADLNFRENPLSITCPGCGQSVPIPGANAGVQWDDDREGRPKNVIITAEGLGIIKKQLEQLDSQSKLTPDVAELYERFLSVEAEVVEKEPVDEPAEAPAG